MKFAGTFRGSMSLLVAAGLLAGLRAQDRALIPCLAATPDWEPIAVNAPVPASGKEMMAVFHLGPDEKINTLTSRWVVIDIGDVAPPGYEVSKGDLVLGGKARDGRLFYRQDGPLPVGSYRLEVFADGKPWRNVEFTVVDPKPPTFGSPAALFPLERGRVWKYDFVQEFGEGMEVDLSGVKLDPDGRFRAAVTITLGEENAKGRHMTLQRDGVVISEEWWQLDSGGLRVTERRADGENYPLDPPQIMLPVPNAGTMRWTYKAPDGSYEQTYRLWCVQSTAQPASPVTLIVVTEQTQPPYKFVIERRFVPGTGLVKTVATTAVNGKFATRETMSLRK